MTVLLVLGGARSGKSRYALARAEAMPGDCLFVATAQALDSEMDSRIARHREERGARWRTIEEPVALDSIVRTEARPGRVLLIDCLTLWASNLMMAERDIDGAVDALVMALRQARGPVILVANEVGLGIVPDNALARRFRDVAGTINQAVATCSDEAVFLAAGLPLTLR
ncbi:bifunctional adenosylcobinamide kinase/adenosylcobinamide-phosphate guanylyltransferase [Sphingobium sp. 3R8]|uniref:Bifunctional adenosylcobalamin biosynthesis protein n=1 Tax=Sphingomonas bisphenolicum TaxID=296544 RepID=A0ABM7G9G2_9SPHN|nr:MULTISPECIES: bifunctional adenosylcobinamide kinase/adenosylcobinamide-phosphate guanylyltransferase [Sphingomonadaceae]MBZ9649619.1 bifunctional adenosylcobinamide kinase/adenosylcobinamide-phosphate guanylyltransferase [Sphingobium sp. 3R8]BBF72105.1 adenosylcobinamide kinase/adenosylcobinamide phosphate guanyltransferase [Sphingomonas bisphenolicum]